MYYELEHLQHFFSKVHIKAENECWEWKAGKDYDGYGIYNHKRKAVRAARWLYQQLHGEITRDIVVRHKCDNPPCVNPNHLEPGTAKQNSKDRDERGRAAIPDRQHLSKVLYEQARRGENHTNHKLKDWQVEWIRNLYPGFKQKELAVGFGVSQTCISKIVRGLRRARPTPKITERWEK